MQIHRLEAMKNVILREEQSHSSQGCCNKLLQQYKVTEHFESIMWGGGAEGMEKLIFNNCEIKREQLLSTLKVK